MVGIECKQSAEMLPGDTLRLDRPLGFDLLEVPGLDGGGLQLRQRQCRTPQQKEFKSGNYHPQKFVDAKNVPL